MGDGGGGEYHFIVVIEAYRTLGRQLKGIRKNTEKNEESEVKIHSILIRKFKSTFVLLGFTIIQPFFLHL